MNEQIDVLDRGGFVLQVLRIVESVAKNKKYCSFAIDGKWGVGKSFVVKLLNEEYDKDRFTIINYNCWGSNYYHEPLLAILSSILDELYNVDYTIKAMDSYKNTVNEIGAILNGVLQTFTGASVKRSGEKSELETISNKIKKVKKIISDLAQEKPIVIIVDEIDRCLPEYAIKVLERIYLLFNELSNVFVITIMDKSQIIHSVKQIFGNNIAIDDYLRKFISFTIPIDNGKVDYSIYEKYDYYFGNFKMEENINNNDDIATFLTELKKCMDIRVLEIIFHRSNIIHNLIVHNKDNDTTLMCAELFISTIYYLKGSYSNDIFNSRSYNNLTNSNRNSSAEYINIEEYLINKIKTNERITANNLVNTKVVLNNTFEERIIWLCDNASSKNEIDISSNHFILKYSDYLNKDNLIAIKEFYGFLQNIR